MVVKRIGAMDLEIELTALRGRKPVEVVAAEVGQLVPADLALLGVERGVQPKPLKRLMERHHALARVLASGTSPADAAIMCGYTVSRISILQSDPAFKELVDFYRREVNLQYTGLHERMAGLAQDAVEELRERLEETPEEISTGQLVDIVKLTADRTGHGPQTTANVNVNIGLAERLEAARRRYQTQIIEGEIVNES